MHLGRSVLCLRRQYDSCIRGATPVRQTSRVHIQNELIEKTVGLKSRVCGCALKAARVAGFNRFVFELLKARDGSYSYYLKLKYFVGQIRSIHDKGRTPNDPSSSYY